MNRLVQGSKPTTALTGNAFFSNDTPRDRATLRREMRVRRRQLPKAAQTAAAKKLQSQILLKGRLWRARRVAVYLASDGEIDLGPLIRILWRMGKKVFLPKIRDTHLRFAPYHPTSKMAPAYFNIPVPTTRRVLPSARLLDIVLMPLVAFDHKGNRLGMGGGYYDRTFAYSHHRRFWRRPRLIGVAHQLQDAGLLDVRPWDVPLAAIATDRAVIWVSGHERASWRK